MPQTATARTALTHTYSETNMHMILDRLHRRPITDNSITGAAIDSKSSIDPSASDGAIPQGPISDKTPIPQRDDAITREQAITTPINRPGSNGEIIKGIRSIHSPIKASIIGD